MKQEITVDLTGFPTAITDCQRCKHPIKYTLFHDKAQTMPRRKPTYCKTCKEILRYRHLTGRDA
jgi:hypothetical protein